MRSHLATLVVSASILFTSTALADVSPDTEACKSKKAGEACVTDSMTSGACVDSTCMGSPPGPAQVACLLCEEGVAPTAVADEEEEDDSGCAIGRKSAASAIGLA